MIKKSAFSLAAIFCRPHNLSKIFGGRQQKTINEKRGKIENGRHLFHPDRFRIQYPPRGWWCHFYIFSFPRRRGHFGQVFVTPVGFVSILSQTFLEAVRVKAIYDLLCTWQRAVISIINNIKFKQVTYIFKINPLSSGNAESFTQKWNAVNASKKIGQSLAWCRHRRKLWGKLGSICQSLSESQEEIFASSFSQESILFS